MIKKISIIVLLLMVLIMLYFGLFNHNYPILFLNLFILVVTLLLYIILKDGKFRVLKFNVLKGIRFKELLKSSPLIFLSFVSAFSMELHTEFLSLYLLFCFFKTIFIIELLISFVIDLTISE